MNIAQDHPELAAVLAGRHYLIATDGAARGNPGPAGWGLVKQLKDGDTLLRQGANAGQAETLVSTNNRMEMTAAIMALEKTADPETPVVVLTDSQIVYQGMTEWLAGWKARGWRTKKGVVSNLDLWERLDQACQGRAVHWVKVPGHSGIPLNEMADTLASNAADGHYSNGQASVRRRHPEWFI